MRTKLQNTVFVIVLALLQGIESGPKTHAFDY
jgi:hypothetical protein